MTCSFNRKESLSLLDPSFKFRSGIFYTDDTRCFTTNNDEVILDIFELFNVWDINSWLTLCEENGQGYGQLRDRLGNMVEFFYMERVDNDDDRLDYMLACDMPYAMYERPIFPIVSNGIKERILNNESEF